MYSVFQEKELKPGTLCPFLFFLTTHLSSYKLELTLTKKEMQLQGVDQGTALKCNEVRTNIQRNYIIRL